MVAALGVEHRQPRADLGGEREEVELGPDAPVVAPFGLLEAMEVLGQRLVGLPRRAVDALELGAVLVAAPVGAGHPQELEVPEPTRRGHVRPPAQVDEAVVAIRAHRRGRRARCQPAASAESSASGDAPATPSMISRLKGWSENSAKPSSIGVLLADEGLVRGHDGAHLLLDAPEVVVTERGPARQLEVVVEAVRDRRADGVVGAGPQVEHRLGQHVRGGVAQHGPARLAVLGDHRHLGAVGKAVAEVDGRAVDDGRHRRLGQAPTDRRGQVERRWPRPRAPWSSRRAAGP